MGAYIVGVLGPLVFTLLFSSKNGKKMGCSSGCWWGTWLYNPKPRFTSSVEMAWEGITNLAELFEQACKQHFAKRLLGTRKLISREIETSEDGRSFAKLHLGDYKWLTYGQAFEAVCNFASG
ncbi:hypothetical protein ACH5RR_034007 [Cinchona calisaya]|uniref:Uncharacterized protein n=1 Tax=Cinchona calisaya TaxID=153742 RepID=A0ABD2YAW5_9GENT